MRITVEGVDASGEPLLQDIEAYHLHHQIKDGALTIRGGGEPSRPPFGANWPILAVFPWERVTMLTYDRSDE